MTFASHRVAAVAGTGVALLFVSLVACTGGGGHPSSSSTAGSGDQAMVDFAHCMRDHGIADFPDPSQRPGHTGLSIEFPGGFDPSSGPDKVAYDACVHFIQPLVDAKHAGVGAELTAEKLQALLAYSRCMRDHQIPLLDPDPTDGHISLGSVPGLTDPPDGRRDPLFAAADAACRNLLPADVPDDGTGPP